MRRTLRPNRRRETKAYGTIDDQSVQTARAIPESHAISVVVAVPTSWRVTSTTHWIYDNASRLSTSVNATSPKIDRVDHSYNVSIDGGCLAGNWQFSGSPDLAHCFMHDECIGRRQQSRTE